MTDLSGPVAADSVPGAAAFAGLTGAEASDQLLKHGPNAVEPAAPERWLRVLLRQFRGLIVAVLAAAAAVSFAFDDHAEGYAILVVIVPLTRQRRPMIDDSDTPPPHGQLLISKGWVQAAAMVVLFGFFVLGLLAYRTYIAGPPIPAQVLTDDDVAVFSGADVQEGQRIFLRTGLMQYGSIFGHGAYLGPDFTADYLRRAATHVHDGYERAGERSPAARVADEFKPPERSTGRCSKRRSRSTWCLHPAPDAGGLLRRDLEHVPLRSSATSARQPPADWTQHPKFSAPKAATFSTRAESAVWTVRPDPHRQVGPRHVHHPHLVAVLMTAGSLGRRCCGPEPRRHERPRGD